MGEIGAESGTFLYMIEQDTAAELLNTLARISVRGRHFREAAMQMLIQQPGYDWCGIYRLEHNKLILDAYVGEPTEHTEIAVGVGVCGTAVAEDRDLVIEDVREVDNYLACSNETRSEIVVLIRKGDEVLGQIDIDGHRTGQFDESDRAFLTELAEIIATHWEGNGS